MSNYDFLQPRERNKHLFIVEGNHERNEWFSFLLRCFPEIDIDLADVVIYGTNIYHLHQDLINEYGIDWTEKDVDLPFVVSQKKGITPAYHKRNFSNIFLVFDYERQDTFFSEEKIVAMQKYFADVSGNGQLFINYPMVEAYQHVFSIPDLNYQNYKVSVSLQRGNEYKNKVKDSIIAKLVEFERRLDTQLKERFNVADQSARNNCIEQLLLINNSDSLLSKVTQLLAGVLDEQELASASHYLTRLIHDMQYADLGKTFFEYGREIMCAVICHNICKANLIQNNLYQIPTDELQTYFMQLDMNAILQNQNKASRDPVVGIIWVLSTSMLFVPDYNFSLLGDIEE